MLAAARPSACSGDGPAVVTTGYLVDTADIQGMYTDLGYAGARAAGGPVAGGKQYLVGENGPELVTMGGAGQVTNANSTASILSGGRDTLTRRRSQGGYVALRQTPRWRSPG